jgi:AraC family transcriptional regulator
MDNQIVIVVESGSRKVVQVYSQPEPDSVSTGMGPWNIKNGMPLLTHAHRVEGSAHISEPIEMGDVRIENRMIEPAFLRPAVFKSHAVVVALSGRSPVRRRAQGLTRQGMIRPGMSCVEPFGFNETEVEIAAPIECLYVYLAPELVNRSTLQDFGIDPSGTQLAYAGGLTDPLLVEVATSLKRIMSRKPDAVDRLFVDGVKSMLAAHLIRNYQINRWRPPSERPTLPYAKLKRVIDLIEAKYRSPISLKELAGEAALSEYHFSRLFREATGLSPYNYVVGRRISEAQARLAKSDRSIAEIAFEVGFGSQSAFNRAFRKYARVTPGDFLTRERKRS